MHAQDAHGQIVYFHDSELHPLESLAEIMHYRFSETKALIISRIGPSV